MGHRLNLKSYKFVEFFFFFFLFQERISLFSFLMVKAKYSLGMVQGLELRNLHFQNLVEYFFFFFFFRVSSLQKSISQENKPLLGFRLNRTKQLSRARCGSRMGCAWHPPHLCFTHAVLRGTGFCSLHPSSSFLLRRVV